MCFRPADAILANDCPNCGEKYTPGETTCKGCGATLNEAPGANPAVAAPGAPSAPGAPKAPQTPGASKLAAKQAAAPPPGQPSK